MRRQLVLGTQKISFSFSIPFQSGQCLVSRPPLQVPAPYDACLTLPRHDLQNCILGIKGRDFTQLHGMEVMRAEQCLGLIVVQAQHLLCVVEGRIPFTGRCRIKLAELMARPPSGTAGRVACVFEFLHIEALGIELSNVVPVEPRMLQPPDEIGQRPHASIVHDFNLLY
jgi:hypothetical protein